MDEDIAGHATMPFDIFLTKNWSQQSSTLRYYCLWRPRNSANVKSPHCCLFFSARIICVFPKIGVPPNHPFVHRVFHYKPSILGFFPLFLETSIYFGLSPFPVIVTTRIVSCLVGNPYKPSFATITGKGDNPTYTVKYWLVHQEVPISAFLLFEKTDQTLTFCVPLRRNLGGGF